MIIREIFAGFCTFEANPRIKRIAPFDLQSPAWRSATHETPTCHRAWPLLDSVLLECGATVPRSPLSPRTRCRWISPPTLSRNNRSLAARRRWPARTSPPPPPRCALPPRAGRAGRRSRSKPSRPSQRLRRTGEALDRRAGPRGVPLTGQRARIRTGSRKLPRPIIGAAPGSKLPIRTPSGSRGTGTGTTAAKTSPG